MNREEFMQLLGDLALAAEALNELAAATVLCALKGSMLAGMDRELGHLAGDHAKAVIARCTAVKERADQVRYHKAMLNDEWADVISAE